MLEPLEMVGFALTWVFSTCCFAVSLLFFLKIKQTMHTTKELKPFLALAFLCLSYGIIHIVAAWLDYYRWSQDIIVIPLWKSFAVILLIANGCASYLGCSRIFNFFTIILCRISKTRIGSVKETNDCDFYWLVGNWYGKCFAFGFFRTYIWKSRLSDDL